MSLGPLSQATRPSGDFQLMVCSTLKSRARTAANRQRARQLAWRWIREKWPRLVHGDMDPTAARLERSCPGASLTVSNGIEGATWVAEVIELARDSREWRTRAAVAEGQDFDILKIEIACSPMATPPAVLAPPKLLAAWTAGLQLHDAAEPVLGEPWCVNDEAAAADFVEHLVAEQRSLPVITLASKGSSRYFGVDPEVMATTMKGMAHVACVTPEARLVVARRLGARLSPVQGAARIYGPGLGPDDPPGHHPLVRPPGPDDTPRDKAPVVSFRQSIIRSACATSARVAECAADVLA